MTEQEAFDVVLRGLRNQTNRKESSGRRTRAAKGEGAGGRPGGESDEDRLSAAYAAIGDLVELLYEGSGLSNTGIGEALWVVLLRAVVPMPPLSKMAYWPGSVLSEQGKLTLRLLDSLDFLQRQVAQDDKFSSGVQDGDE